jgi:hypothetical protein
MWFGWRMTRPAIAVNLAGTEASERPHAVDRADLEDALVEQVPACRALGVVSGPRAALTLVSRWPASIATVCRQALAWQRGRECEHRGRFTERRHRRKRLLMDHGYARESVPYRAWRETGLFSAAGSLMESPAGWACARGERLIRNADRFVPHLFLKCGKGSAASDQFMENLPSVVRGDGGQ